LAARPLTIYTSGGVEKGPDKALVTDTGTKSFRSRRSVGIIKRNDDGTTTVLYPDSDDEEELLVHPAMKETVVVEGEFFCIDITHCRIAEDCGTTNNTKCATYINIRSSMAAEVSGYLWRRL
jgi:hypothetical protein